MPFLSSVPKRSLAILKTIVVRLSIFLSAVPANNFHKTQVEIFKQLVFSYQHFKWFKVQGIKIHLLVILRHRVAQQNASCSPFMLHKKNFFSVEVWRMRLTALGKKVLCSLVVGQRILPFHLPEGSSVNRLLLGWVLSFHIPWTLCRNLTSPISLILSRWVPLMFWVGHHPQQSLPVLGHAHTMPICNVSSQDAFYCSSVKVDENLGIFPSDFPL